MRTRAGMDEGMLRAAGRCPATERMLESGEGKQCPGTRPGDYVKAEFRDEQTSESEWMWLHVDSCDDANRLVFGRLDSVPALDYGRKLELGSQLAVSFDNIREHRKPSEFSR